MHKFNTLSGRALRNGISAVAVSAILLGIAVAGSDVDFGFAAWADSHSNDDAGHGGSGGGGHGGGSRGGGGHDDGTHDDGTHDDGGHDDGTHDDGGHDDSEHIDGDDGDGHAGGDRDGNGGKGKGSSQTGNVSGRAVWAGGGIPEVELGRMNVVRAPKQVLDRAYVEALATFDAKKAAFYSLSLNQMIAELSQNWDNVSIYDSPLQNLALMRDALDGKSALSDVGVTNDINTLMAAFLGTASDKSLPITRDTALAVSIMLGKSLTSTEAAVLAAQAEKIRTAILFGHG